LEGNQSLKWDGLTKGLPTILISMDKLAEDLNCQLSVTLFCRADWQIETEMGDSAWVFKKTKEVLNKVSLKNVKTSLEWHPHLYHFEENKWLLAKNEQIQKRQLLDIYPKLNAEGFEIRCSRIGECFFSSQILTTLSCLGIKIDSSAFPGRNIGHTDWTSAPTYPYYPLEDNFTKVGTGGVLEVPFTMIPIRAPYEKKEALRYLNLNFSPSFTLDGIKNHKGPVFVTIIHPFEILTLGQDFTHQLFGSVDSITENLKLIYQQSPIHSISMREYHED